MAATQLVNPTDTDDFDDYSVDAVAGAMGLPGEAPTAPTPDPPPSVLARWKAVWQAPILLLGLGLVAIGVYLSLPTATPHDFDAALDSAQQYVIANELEGARAQLAKIAPFIGEANPRQRSRHMLITADVRYQQHRNVPEAATPESLKQLLMDYQLAADFAPPLDALHVERYAETLVMLGREEEALAALEPLKKEGVNRRYVVLRQIIEQRLSTAASTKTDITRAAADVAPLIEQFEDELRHMTDLAARRAGRIWSESLRAKLTTSAGDPDAAGRRLEQVMARFMSEGGDKDLGPLMVLLGRCHQLKGEYADAERWYLLAQQTLPEQDAQQAAVLVGLGQVALAADGNDRAALEHFSAAETNFPGTSSYLDALMGRADTEARLGVTADAMEHFTRAVTLVLDGSANAMIAGEVADRLASLLRGRFTAAFDAAQYDRALDYLAQIERLKRGLTDAELLALYALTHQRLAEQYDQQAAASDPVAAAATAPVDPKVMEERLAARRLARQNAAVHHDKAGDHYQRHAAAMRVTDDAQFGDSLWKAAESYDRAHQWKKAIRVYADYVEARPQDPRRLDAIARLGLAYEADKQFEPAIDLFEKLIEEHPKTQQTYDSLVPMARCYTALRKIDDAKRVLLHVVTDHPAITPDSNAYREALCALGKLYYRQGEFPEAIERLEVAVERYGDNDDGPELRYLLADAYRQSGAELAVELMQPMPAARKTAMRTEYERRLNRATMLFSQVVSQFEASSPATMNDLRRLYLRNAYFYRADALYDLGRYEEAISLYDQAASQFDKHPASLVGLIQIVNAYCELGRYQEARVANDKARWQLNQIPEEAFNDPTLPMSRQRWQDWLKWTSQLKLFDKGAGTPSAAAPAPAGS